MPASERQRAERCSPFSSHWMCCCGREDVLDAGMLDQSTGNRDAPREAAWRKVPLLYRALSGGGGRQADALWSDAAVLLSVAVVAVVASAEAAAAASLAAGVMLVAWASLASVSVLVAAALALSVVLSAE